MENPKMATFPLLLGLQTMSDLDLAASFRTGVIRDPVGSPYRLYPRGALAKLNESLRILTAKWSKGRTVQPIRSASKRSRGGNGQDTAKEDTYTRERSKPTTHTFEAQASCLGTRSVLGTKETRRPPQQKKPVEGNTAKEAKARPVILWSRASLVQAERKNDHQTFARICLHQLDEVQRFLIRHPEGFERAFPNFHKYVRYRQEHSPYFDHKWKSLWKQRARWCNKPSLRMEKYPVTPMPGGSNQQQQWKPGRQRSKELAERLTTLTSRPAIPLSVRPRTSQDPLSQQVSAPTKGQSRGSSGLQSGNALPRPPRIRKRPPLGMCHHPRCLLTREVQM